MFLNENFIFKNLMTINQKNFFHKNGFLIVKNFYDKKLINQIKKDIFDISLEVYKKYNKKYIPFKYNEKKFDEIVIRARRENLTEVTSAVYDSCKKLRGFYKLISDDKLNSLAEKTYWIEKIRNSSRRFWNEN